MRWGQLLRALVTCGIFFIMIVKTFLQQGESTASSSILLVPHGVDRRRAGRQVAAGLLTADKKGRALVLRGAHPDLIELSPPQGKEAIGIDQVRAVIRQGQFSPTQGKRKVCMITDAAALTPAAANSLLKILEEPPRGLTFLLLVEQAGDLLPTIRSRSRVIRLPPLSRGDQLRRLIDNGYPTEEANYLITITRGKQDLMERFLTHRIEVATKRDKTRERAHTVASKTLLEMVTADDPISRYEGSIALLERLIDDEGTTVVLSAKALAKTGRDQVDEFLEGLAYIVLDLIHAHPNVRSADQPEASLLKQGLRIERLLELSAATERARRSLKGYTPLEPLLLWILLIARRLNERQKARAGTDIRH
ncbi:MAG: hypothetical protein U9Q23_02890 [Candidatus Bipolaricaulota bacterium]|nr:hypothetical protein [Candidatus Bipolaricaulota bacterium]